ncbi:MAG: pyridoxamine 5'-phosphate oxidase family protein [Acidimicrobiia bacterium]
MNGDDVDIDVFLQRPLMARIATNGPTLRAVWYIFEDGVFWWLTNTETVLSKAIAGGEPLVVVVDVCDIATGEVVYVRARGRAELLVVDRERALRKFARYLGPQQTEWDPRFVMSLDDPTARMARMSPTSIEAGDLSFVVDDRSAL